MPRGIDVSDDFLEKRESRHKGDFEAFGDGKDRVGGGLVDAKVPNRQGSAVLPNVHGSV